MNPEPTDGEDAEVVELYPEDANLDEADAIARELGLNVPEDRDGGN